MQFLQSYIKESGSGLLTRNWTGPNGFSSSSLHITGLCPGIYTLTVTKSAICVFYKQFEICCCEEGVPALRTQYNVPTGVAPECPGGNIPTFQISEGIWKAPSAQSACNGFITPTINGLPEPTFYLWTYPDGKKSNKDNINNLCLPGEDCHRNAIVRSLLQQSPQYLYWIF